MNHLDRLLDDPLFERWQASEFRDSHISVNGEGKERKRRNEPDVCTSPSVYSLNRGLERPFGNGESRDGQRAEPRVKVGELQKVGTSRDTREVVLKVNGDPIIIHEDGGVSGRTGALSPEARRCLPVRIVRQQRLR